MGQTSRATSRKTPGNSPVLPLLAILLVTFISYSPSLKNGFTDWDDRIYVSQNPLVERLSFENLKTIFTTSHNGIYIPLSMISYSLEYALFGKNPQAYHATNLLLHLLNSLLVFWIFYRLNQKKVFLAFIVGILFGVHPLHVESVAWISERKDVLYAFFYFLALGSYLRHSRDGDKRAYWLSLAFFFLSLLSKPMGMTFPLILILVDYCATGNLRIKRLGRTAPFLLLSLVFSIAAIFASRPQSAMFALGAAAPVPVAHRIVLAVYGIAFYALKIFFPFKLAALYPYRETLKSLDPLLLYLSPVVLGILAVIVVVSLRFTKKVLFGVIFFLISLAPILQIVSIPGNSIVADRYTYVASLGIFYLAALFLTWNIWDKMKPIKLVRTVILACLVVVLSMATFGRCRVWKSDLTLWSDVLNKYPGVPVAHNKLGLVYAENGDTAAAISEYDQAIALDPSATAAYNNRAAAYKSLGQYDQAMADYAKATELNPLSAELRYNLGNLYHELGMHDRAIEQFTEALRLDPRSSAKIFNNRGLSRAAQGDLNGAIADYSKAIETLPTFDLPYVNRGMALSCLAQYDRALADLDKAIEQNPGNARAYFGRGLTRAKMKEYEKALADFDKALIIKPDYEDALNKRIYIYLVRKEYEKAIREIERLQSLGLAIEPGLLEFYKKAKAGNY